MHNLKSVRATHIMWNFHIGGTDSGRSGMENNTSKVIWKLPYYYHSEKKTIEASFLWILFYSFPIGHSSCVLYVENEDLWRIVCCNGGVCWHLVKLNTYRSNATDKSHEVKLLRVEVGVFRVCFGQDQFLCKSSCRFPNVLKWCGILNYVFFCERIVCVVYNWRREELCE